MPVRVGILHYTCPPVIGGVEQLIAIHARLLRAAGHEVVVLAGRGGQFRRDITLRRIPLLDSKHPRVVAAAEVLARGVVPPTFSGLVESLDALLGEATADLDALIVHNALTLHFNLALSAALDKLSERGGLPLVAWCHDLAWTNPLYLSILHEAWPWTLLRTALPGVRYVVVSEDRRADFARLSGLADDRIAVVPAGVDPARKLALGPATVRLLTKYDLLHAHPFLLLPVRITKRKNIEYALRVIAHLRDDHLSLDPRLVVTGPPGPHNVRSGDYVAELLDLRTALDLERRVHFLFQERTERGRGLAVTDQVMDELYRAADLMLLPSSQEGFGIPMLEAGIARLPIFCADIPPLRETADGGAHFFALSEDPAQTAARVAAYCADDPSYRLRKRVLDHFTWERIYAERIAPLLTEAPLA